MNNHLINISKADTLVDYFKELTNFYEGRELEKGHEWEIFNKFELESSKVFTLSYLLKIKTVVLHTEGIDPSETCDQKKLREEILKKFNIAAKDKGIDGYFKTERGEYGAFQSKYRDSYTNTITFNDKIGTFLNLSSETPLNLVDPNKKRDIKFKYKIIFSSVPDVPEDYNNDQITFILKDDHEKFINSYTEMFNESPFKSFSEYLKVGKSVERSDLKPKFNKLNSAQRLNKINAKKHFIKDGNTRGICDVTTGVGKTGMMNSNVFEVFGNGYHIIVSPWVHLLYQIVEETIRYSNNLGIYFNAGIVYSDDENDSNLKSFGVSRLNTEDSIVEYIGKNKKEEFNLIFVTYDSLYKIINATKKYNKEMDPDFKWRSKNNDEAHRSTYIGPLTTSLRSIGITEKNFPVDFIVSYTATVKTIDSKERSRLEGKGFSVISMDDQSMYGKRYISISHAEAVKRNYISDFRIIFILDAPGSVLDDGKKIKIDGIPLEKFGIKSRHYRGLGMCRELLDSGVIKKPLLKNNSNTSSMICVDVASKLFNDSVSIHFTNSNSSSEKNKHRTIDKFGSSEKSALFYCEQLNEGIDVRSCDSIFLLDPIKSPIKIKQSAGRTGRKDPQNSEKISYIICPVSGEMGEDGKVKLIDGEYESISNILKSLSEGAEKSLFEDFEISISNSMCVRSSNKKSRIILNGFDFNNSNFQFDFDGLIMGVMKSSGLPEYDTSGITRIINDLMNEARKIEEECLINGYCLGYFLYKVDYIIKKYHPSKRGSTDVSTSYYIDNPDYDESVYGDIKIGVPAFRTDQGFVAVYYNRYGKAGERLPIYADETSIKRFIDTERIQSPQDLRRIVTSRDHLDREKVLKHGIPSRATIKSKYGDVFYNSLFVTRMPSKNWEKSRIDLCYDKIVNGKSPLVVAKEESTTAHILFKMFARRGYKQLYKEDGTPYKAGNSDLCKKWLSN